MKTIITATNRLARERQQQYDQQQLANGKQAWASLDVLSWSAWLARNNHGVKSARLISALEQQQLWAHIIEQDLTRQDQQQTANNAALWNVQASARQAMLAWQLLKNWDIPLDNCKFSSLADHNGFARWARQYAQQLKQSNWLDEASLLCQLADSPPEIKNTLELHGFEEFNPVQQRLLGALQKFGTVVEYQNAKTATTQPNQANIKLHQFAKPENEWAQIGAWARQILEQQPDARIAIVTPDLEANRDLASLALKQQLSPGQADNDAGPSANQLANRAAFHLSIGKPLASYSMIQTALNLLQLTGQLAFENISYALTSPYSFTQTHVISCFELEKAMRRKVAAKLDIYACVRVVQQQNPPLANLKKALSALLAAKKSAPSKQSYRQWAEFFSQWLKLAEWPGAGLSSHEYQLMEAWQGCLQQLSQLDQLGQENISLKQAKSVLIQICQQTQFQAEAQADTPIQVMGMLEASGLAFDYLWVAGLHEHAWPSNRQANPFIPISAQVKAGWSGAKPQQHYQLAEKRLQQLLTAAPEVQLSYASSVEGVEVAASALIQALQISQSGNPSKATTELSETTLAKPIDWLQHQSQQAPSLETLTDQQAPALNPGPTQRGLSRIQSQAACPFQAFARYRLNATFEPEPEWGINALERGSLVHKVLEDFWSNMHSQAKLRQCIEHGLLQTELQSHVDRRMAEAAKNSGLGAAFSHCEATYFTRLIAGWLTIELGRPAFTVIQHEQDMQANINGMSFTFRVDRLDEIEAGKLAVIDYKTGKCFVNSWCGERLDSPQLPLYALAVSQQLKPINAVLYAQVRANENQFIGLAEHGDLLPNILPPEKLSGRTLVHQDLGSWAEALPLWQQRLEALVSQHLTGEAQVDPKNTATCQYCELSALCRINQENISLENAPQANLQAEPVA